MVYRIGEKVKKNKYILFLRIERDSIHHFSMFLNYIRAGFQKETNDMKTNKSILSALVLTSLIGGVAGATTVTDNDINVGQGNTNNASYTMSVGLNNSVNSRNTIAVGEGNYVNSEGSRVGGYQNSVVGNYSNVTGYQNHVNGTSVNVSGYNNTVNQAQNGLVFGNSNTANGENAFVGGENATADGRNAFAYGASAYAQAYTFAMGTNATAKAADAIALGNDSKALGATSIAVGLDNTVKSDDTIAIGAHNGEINAIQSVVTGYNNQVVGTDPEQLIYGSNSKTSAQGAIVVGTHSEATAMDATVIGNNAIASVPNSVAIGTNSTTELGTDVANIQDGNSDIRFKNIDFAGSHVDSVVSFGANGTAGYGGVSDYKRQLQNVAAGRVNATSTDAINGSQLYDTALEAQKHNTMADGTNTTVTATDNNYGRKEYKVNVNADLNNMSSVNFGAVTDSVHNHVDKNGMSTFDGDIDAHFKADGVYLENRNNLDTAQYTMDGMRADSNGKSVAFGTDGINAGNQVVSGVDTGVADTDAVNVKQLKDYVAANDKDTHTTVSAGNRVTVTSNNNTDGTPNYTVAIDQATSDQINNNSSAINTLNQTINNVTDRYDSLTRTVSNNQKEARRGVAGAAAVAALHPLDFDPDHKLDIMAGVGHFKGQTATALGLAYRPNEDVMFTLGGAINGSDSVLNAGISYKVGAKSNVSRSRVAVAKDLQDLKATVAKLQADNEKLKAIVNAVTGANMTVEQDKLFPDVPNNHWAYEAVEGLRQRGLVIGYEDGNFKGDRLLTRYEFAQIVYRALQRAQETSQDVDARLIEEFSPEMARFKVDQMGKGIERVHVQTSTKDVHRDAYGTILK